MLTYNNKRLTIERLFRILEQECKEGEQNTWRQKQNFSQRNKITDRIDDSADLILGPLSIPLPFSPVPISFTNLVLYFSFLYWEQNSVPSLILYTC